ncbi:hypothetical protein ACSBM8_17920 [Sphingomonas sp. ASY06-1R]|uniref:hypothetical protein n=1 Tax=Sphingomonas sp. ASY06-1R TaxID=3445771 RepID=UPI003FA27A13
MLRFGWTALAAIVMATQAGAEVAGEDHPLLPRYEGAEIRAYRAPSVDQVTIPVARIGDADATTGVRLMEGTVTHIDYVVSPATATLQIGRYYEALLQRAGFRFVFTCAGEQACGGDMGKLVFNSGRVSPTGFADGLFGDRMRVIVAQRGGSWVFLHIYEGPDRSTIYEIVVDGAAG